MGDLTGYVNWIVYDKKLPVRLPEFRLYADGGEFTYVYQVFLMGTDNIHGFSVALKNQADNIGVFGSAPGRSARLVERAGSI